MADVSSSSSVLFALALVAIAILVLLLLRHYVPLRSTPAYLLLPVFLALFLPASIILLVPIDLASAVTDTEETPHGLWLPERALLVFWRISYWLTFVLTWFILPLLGDYADAGHREPRERFLYSLKTNIRYQLIVLGSAIAGGVYFFISSGLEVHSLKAMVMALAYAWGLVLAIYLMGHGLVSIPRKLYRNASVSGRLRRLQGEAPRIYERLTESIDGLEALEAQVLQLRQRKTGTARDFQEWIDELVETTDLPQTRISAPPASRLPEATVPAVVTDRYLADLTRKLKRARHRRIRFIEEWDSCVRKAQRLQAILDAAGSQRLDLSANDFTAVWLTKRPLLTPYTRYHLHATLAPGLRLFAALITALASLSIIWTEIFSRAVPSLSIIAFTISPSSGSIHFPGQLIAGSWLLYMTAAALISTSEVRVWGNRALVARHTYAESACWYASLVARLTVPLSYNFITFLPASIYKETAFFKFLGKLIVLTPLGTGFSAFFPMLILLPVAATAFNLYGKVQAFAGFGAFEDETEEDSAFGGGWRDGKALIEREVNGVNTLGLLSRDASPRPGPLRPKAVPQPGRTASPMDTSSSQYRDDATSATLAPSAAAGRTARPAPGTSAVQEEDEAGGGFFADFAHRVRNTMDTVEPPKFIRVLDIQRPKWMAGGGDANSGGGLQRWFGRAGESGVRL